MKRDALCPGARRLCAYVVERWGNRSGSDAADTGTRCHDVMRATVQHMTRQSPASGPWCPMLIATQFAEKYVDRMHATLAGYDRWSIAQAIIAVYDLIDIYHAQPCLVFTEIHLSGQHEIGLDPQHGQADLVILDPFRRLVIVDYKFGWLYQDEAEDNDQMACYAVLGRKTYTVDEAHVAVIQPRQRDCRVSRARFDRTSLENTARWIADVSRRCKDPRAQLCASYMACIYCEAAPWCAACGEWMIEAQDMIYQLETADEPDLVAGVIERAKIAAKIGKDGTEIARELIAHGCEVPGWGLGKPSVTREITDFSAARGIAEDNGLASTFAGACTVSAAKLREVLGPDAFTALFGKVTKENTNKPSVVRCKGGS